MVFKKGFLFLLCGTSAMAGAKKPLPQDIEATEDERSELNKWAFPAVISGACLLLLWHNRACQPVIATPKTPVVIPPEQPAAAPQHSQNQQVSHNPPAPKPKITYKAIDPMEVGELLKEVTNIYTAQHVHQEPCSKFTLPFTDLDKKELCQHSLSTIELPSIWNCQVAEIVIVADRRTPGKHSYTIFSTMPDVRNTQPVKDFFAVVEPGMS